MTGETTISIPCEKCGGRTAFVGSVTPLGSQPGSQVFQCQKCEWLTWIETRAERRNQT